MTASRTVKIENTGGSADWFKIGDEADNVVQFQNSTGTTVHVALGDEPGEAGNRFIVNADRAALIRDANSAVWAYLGAGKTLIVNQGDGSIQISAINS